jgi:hypothetical protein
MTPEEMNKEAQRRLEDLMEKEEDLADISFSDRLRMMTHEMIVDEIVLKERMKEIEKKEVECPSFYFSFCPKCDDTTSRKTNFCIRCGSPKEWDFKPILCECGAATNVCGKAEMFCGNCGKWIKLEDGR